MTYPIVEVSWYDAHSTSGWDTIAEYQATGDTVLIVRTVGFLLRRTATALVILQTITTDATEGADAITIPRCMVHRIRYLVPRSSK